VLARKAIKRGLFGLSDNEFLFLVASPSDLLTVACGVHLHGGPAWEKPIEKALTLATNRHVSEIDSMIDEGAAALLMKTRAS
jgi:hypothetical protein